MNARSSAFLPECLVRHGPAIAAMAVAAFTSATAAAQDASTDVLTATRAETQGSNLALGIGIASRQLPYTGVKRDNIPLPLVFWDSHWLKLDGTGLEVKLARASLSPEQRLSAGLRLTYQLDGYKASDSPALVGMEDRKSSIWGGVGVTWTNPIAQVNASWLADLSDHSRGQKLQIQAEHRFAWNNFGITPKLQAQWMDSKVVDYYFGVRQQEALPTRPAYVGTAATSIGAGVRLDYIVGMHHTLFVDLGATHLPNEIKRSPIVDRANPSQIALGYLYRF
jgi:outer membrane protein